MGLTQMILTLMRHISNMWFVVILLTIHRMIELHPVQFCIE